MWKRFKTGGKQQLSYFDELIKVYEKTRFWETTKSELRTSTVHVASKQS